MRRLRVGLIGVMCWVTGCVDWHPRVYRHETLDVVVNDFQRYSRKTIELDRGVRSIRISALIFGPPLDKGVENFIYGLPNYLPVRVVETANSYQVHCLRSDCEWPSAPP
jgi:ferric-dicitrate binding protein FerR (iron transport regulator)